MAEVRTPLCSHNSLAEKKGDPSIADRFFHHCRFPNSDAALQLFEIITSQTSSFYPNRIHYMKNIVGVSGEVRVYVLPQNISEGNYDRV